MLSPVLFIADRSTWSTKAYEYLLRYAPNARAIRWDYGESNPPRINVAENAIVLSFKSDLILPGLAIARARHAINIHPAPPQYRGIGGYTHAVAQGDPQYGVTCHHMTERIDFGPIIKVARFPIPANMTPDALRELTGEHCLIVFREIIALLNNRAVLPVADERWGDHLYTRAELSRFLLACHDAAPRDASSLETGRKHRLSIAPIS